MDVKTSYQRAVELIFNNWTALQLAVEHGMGGPQSQLAARQFADYMTDKCCDKANIEVEEIEDIIIDILDSEFNTECEDNSPQEVSQELWRIFQLCKTGNCEQFNVEIQRLQRPDCKQWLACSVNATQPQDSQASENEDEEDDNTEGSSKTCDEPMETSDPPDEWTVVRKGRKH